MKITVNNPDIFEQVTAWQDETFKDHTASGLKRKLQEEIEEFIATDYRDLEELADVCIVGTAYCKDRGSNLRDEMQKKLDKNKNRSWNLTPEGNYKHGG